MTIPSHGAITLLIGCMALFSSCDGLFDAIYDSAETASAATGVASTDSAASRGTLYINATDYDRWTFIDLHSLTVDSVQISGGGSDPETWDFAVHRYDARTNGGSALETDATSFDELTGDIDTASFVHDEWTDSTVMIDLSHMMQGTIVYTSSWYNAELSRWLDRDTSVMPPVYTLSGRVYLVRFKDGTLAALLLRDFMSAAGVKGYLTIDYMYPYEL